MCRVERQIIEADADLVTSWPAFTGAAVFSCAAAMALKKLPPNLTCAVMCTIHGNPVTKAQIMQLVIVIISSNEAGKLHFALWRRLCWGAIRRGDHRVIASGLSALGKGFLN